MIYPQNFEPKIGFDQIRQLLSEKCLSTLGAERVADMTFSDHFEEVEERLNLVTEFVRIIQEEDNFPAQYFFDVRTSLKRIRIEGMYLDEQGLPLPLSPEPRQGYIGISAADSEDKQYTFTLWKDKR